MKHPYLNYRKTIPINVFNQHYDELKQFAFRELVKPQYRGYNNCDVVYRIEFYDFKSYIGQSSDYYNNRLIKHLLLLNNSRSVYYSGHKVNQAIKNIGVNNIEILYKLEGYEKKRDNMRINDVADILTEKERYYIAAYDSINNGYNSRL